MTERFRYATQGAPNESGKLAKYVSDLLVAAVTKATLDYWVATDGLATHSYTAAAYKKNPYEVTTVQHMIEVIASHGGHGKTPVWEVGFKANLNKRGRPVSVDVVLEDESSTAHDKHALVEFGVGTGRFDAKKIKEDLNKLTGLMHDGAPVTGHKHVHFVVISPNKVGAYRDYLMRAKSAVAAVDGTLLCARRFSIYRPGAREYISIGSYEAA